MLKYRPLEAVEHEIEEHYRMVRLTALGITETANAIRAELGLATGQHGDGADPPA